MFQNIESEEKTFWKFCSRMHAYVAIKEYTSVKRISEISPLTRMPLSHEYRVEECGRTQKLRGPGGEGAVCEFCNRYFPSEKSQTNLPPQSTPPPPPTVGQEAVELICQSERKTQKMQ